ncbi:Stress response protein nst1 [Coemansia sp. RSA 1200]|nr:Stress response protein nst1 [Coemansia sp. RSA 1200]
MSSAEESAKTTTVFGPELPPSMARGKTADLDVNTVCEPQPESSDATAERSSLSIFMHGAPRDGVYKSDYMSRTEVDLQRLFYSRLVSIMASHGFKEHTFTEENVVSVMLARGLMKSASDDPVLALASELNDEMTEIVYSNMKQVVNSAIETGRLTRNPSEQTASDGHADMGDGPLVYNDNLVDNPAECDGIMRLMQSHSLHDSARNIATMSLEATISLEPNSVRNIDETDDVANKALVPNGAPNDVELDFPEYQSKDSFPTPQNNRLRLNELRCSVILARCRDNIMTWDLAGKLSAPSGSSSGGSKNNTAKDAEGIWIFKNFEEQKGVRKFWMSLHDTDRQALLLVEKHVVISRIRNHQNFSCPCNVCTRKREAIEFELMSLYDSYYKSVQKNTLRERLRELTQEVGVDSENESQLAFFEAFEKATEDFIKKYANDPKEQEKAQGYRKLMTYFNNWLANQDVENLEDTGIDVVKPSEKLNEVMTFLVKRMCMFKSRLGDIQLDSGSSGGSLDGAKRNDSIEYNNNNDIFYTGSMLETAEYFPTDGKKFFDMMERLAEYHMREEDTFLLDDGVYDHDIDDEDLYKHSGLSIEGDPAALKAAQLQRGTCPDCHGEIRAHDDRQPYPNSDDRDATSQDTSKRLLSRLGAGKDKSSVRWNGDADGCEDDDEYVDASDSDGGESCDMADADMHLGDTDDELDESDPEIAENEAEDARKAFQLFAARLFEQRVIDAYREKVVQDRQRNLIEELEAEEKRSQAKDKRKQKRKQREKERKRQVQQQREEERLAKEELVRVEKERKKEAELQRLKEQEKKKKEELMKSKRAIEERNRRILEEADKRLERERREKLERERELLEKEERRARKQVRDVRESSSQKGTSETVAQILPALSESASSMAPADSSQIPTSIPPPTNPPVIESLTPPSAANSSAATHKPETLCHPSAVPSSFPSRLALANNVPGSSLLAASSPVVSTDGNGFPFLRQGSTTTSASVTTSGDGIPLLDSLQHMSTFTPISALGAQRPSLPTSINPFELPGTSPIVQPMSPQRARSNSRANFIQTSSAIAMTASVPAPVPPAVVSRELDAEITSIVGRVMGCCSTLQDDLTEGAEWRTKPAADRLLESQCSTLPLSGVSAAIVKPVGASSPLLDLPIRRNSAPLNRAASATAAFSNSESLSLSWRDAPPVTMDKMTEDVYLAYCALERFRYDKPRVSAEQDNPKFGGFYSAAELSQMHGTVSERGVWGVCVRFGQANPSLCHLNHADRSISFALDIGTKTLPLRQQQQQQQQQQHQYHQPALTEDMLNAFSLHPCSPLLKPQQARPSATTPAQGSAPPPTMPMASAVSSTQPLMQPFAHQTQQPGMSYSPASSQSQTPLFFNQMSVQTGGNLYNAPMPYSLPPFQPSPLNSAGFAQYPSSANESPIAKTILPHQQQQQQQQQQPLFSAHSPALGLATAKSMPMSSSGMWSVGIPSDNGMPRQMIRSVIQRQTRAVIPLRASLGRARLYADDAFEKRESASENKYIHEKEMAQLKELREKLENAKKQVDDIEAKIGQRQRESELENKNKK